MYLTQYIINYSLFKYVCEFRTFLIKVTNLQKGTITTNML